MLLGYNTNGFAHHPLLSAIEVIHEIGYRGVAITLDHAVLNPLLSGVEEQALEVRARLDARQMTSVIETGARYLLDSRRKHHPTLVSARAADRACRLDFLRRAIDVAALLDSACVSIWSGALEAGRPPAESTWAALTTSLRELLQYADARGVVVAFEPEPGMFIDTMDAYAQLVERVDRPNLRLTLDLGHLHCLGETPIGGQIERWQDHIANIHIEDMRQGVHEHLMFGEGEMNFSEIASALIAIDYAGPVNVELSRHSHQAPEAARKSFEFLQPQFSRAGD